MKAIWMTKENLPKLYDAAFPIKDATKKKLEKIIEIHPSHIVMVNRGSWAPFSEDWFDKNFEPADKEKMKTEWVDVHPAGEFKKRLEARV